MATQDFDKLNILKRRSIPYSEYFGDMELSEKQRARRRELALILEDILAIWFTYMQSVIDTSVLNETSAKQELTYNMYDALDGKDYFTDDELAKYVNNFVDDTYKATVENLQKYPMDYDYTGKTPYWTSDDRAMFMAENEANTICNNAEYLEAVKEGKTHKIWVTYLDNRVRPTHIVVEGAKLPIDVYYDVGEAHMLFPKDVTSEYSTGASHPEETVNCRCSVVYI